jgi:hypothetical protein
MVVTDEHTSYQSRFRTVSHRCSLLSVCEFTYLERLLYRNVTAVTQSGLYCDKLERYDGRRQLIEAGAHTHIQREATLGFLAIRFISGRLKAVVGHAIFLQQPKVSSNDLRSRLDILKAVQNESDTSL